MWPGNPVCGPDVQSDPLATFPTPRRNLFFLCSIVGHLCCIYSIQLVYPGPAPCAVVTAQQKREQFVTNAKLLKDYLPANQTVPQEVDDCILRAKTTRVECACFKTLCGKKDLEGKKISLTEYLTAYQKSSKVDPKEHMQTCLYKECQAVLTGKAS
jgi:hypothetical protein